MRFNARNGIAAALVMALLLASGLAGAAVQPEADGAGSVPPPLANERCLRCHADHEEKIFVRPDGTEHNIFIETGKLDHSVHAKVSCVGCHKDVTKLPHAKPLSMSVGCIDCHKQQHDEAREAAAAPADKLERLGVLLRETDGYLHSVHARPSAKDQTRVNAACHDCHEGHAVPKPGSAERAARRLVNHEVCGSCHEKQKNDWLGSVHGKAIVGKSDAKSAVCSDCHSLHRIGSPKGDPAKLAITANCGSCHEDAQRTFFASYHGQVNRLGYANTAKCHDCHGGHGILGEKDPKSSIHADNRLKTCETCHKDAGPGFATFLAHGDANDFGKNPGLAIAKVFMQALIIGVMAFFWLHVVLWLFRELMDRRQGIGHFENLDQPETVYFRRYSATWRWIHTLFAIATMVLALTGTSLLFAHTGWAKWFVALIGGPQVEAVVHRTAAIIWISIFLVHLVIVGRNIRRAYKFQWFGSTSLLPNWKDLSDLKNMFRWFLGMGPRPEFDRWTYWQKFDYWAPFWGAAVIGLSGMMLFSPGATSQFLPGWVFNLATLVHAEEALLATVFLNTVHFFNVHFRPSRFPMSTTIFTGAIPLEEFKHDHRIEYERLVAKGELERHLVRRISRRVDMLSSVLATILIVAGLTLLTLVLYGQATMP